MVDGKATGSAAACGFDVQNYVFVRATTTVQTSYDE